MGRGDGALWTLAHELVTLMKEQQNFGKDAKQGEHASIAGRSANFYSHYRNQYAVPHKVENWSTSKHSYTTLVHTSKEHSILSHEYLFNCVHCDFIHNNQKVEIT